MTTRFTGWHMAAIMLAFFGTIVSVNVTMAMYATGTFGGTVVDNSYVASQRFNAWLEAARVQEKLGWRSVVTLDGERRVVLDVSAAGATVQGVARHPVGRAEDLPLRFASVGEGRYRSEAALPEGRWKLHLTVTRGDDVARLIEDVR